MNTEQLADLLATQLIDEYPSEFLERLRSAKDIKSSRWDRPVIDLVKNSSPETLRVLEVLVRWVARETAGTVLGVVDPASGADECGDVHLQDCESGEELSFIQSVFFSECEKRGMA